MKNVLKVLISFLFVAIACSSRAQATSTINVTIGGYELRQVKLSPPMEQQLTTEVVRPIESALKRSPGSQITISVYGYADSRTGTFGENASYGLSRAQKASEFLATRIPKGVTLDIPLSGGTGVDERAVTVKVEIEGVPQQVPGRKLFQEKILALILGVSIPTTIVAVAFMLLGSKRRHQKKTVAFKALRNDIPYEVDAVKTEDGFYLPFPPPNNFRKDPAQARRAVKNSMDHPKHRISDEALAKLRAEGKIRIDRTGDVA